MGAAVRLAAGPAAPAQLSVAAVAAVARAWLGLRPRETAVTEECVEPGLEVLLGVGWWRERAEGSRPALCAVAVREGVWAWEAEALGFVDRLLELVTLEDASEVEQGAGGGGDGDAVADGDLVGGESGSMKKEPRPGRAGPWQTW